MRKGGDPVGDCGVFRGSAGEPGIRCAASGSDAPDARAGAGSGDDTVFRAVSGTSCDGGLEHDPFSGHAARFLESALTGVGLEPGGGAEGKPGGQPPSCTRLFGC